jgi:hypothetical protein
VNGYDADFTFAADRPDQCPCCAKAYVTVKGPARYRQQFRSMTGRAWPGAMTYNLHRDYHSLGLDTANAPMGVTLCLVCAVDYMIEFNARIRLAHKK